MNSKKAENRLVYAALILVLTVLAALVVVTGIASRRESRKEGDDTTSGSVLGGRETAEHDPASRFPTTQKPNKNDETKPPVTEPPTTTAPAEDVVTPSETPKFASPSDGAVSKGHSETALVYSMTMNDYRTHTGVDIALYEGAEVRSVADGVVADVWEDPMWGWCVSIDHEGDAESIYKNLSRESAESLEAGETVLAGEVIGSVGDSALCEIADEPHLHFELKLSGVYVDPEEYIEFATEDVFAE